MDKTAEKVLVQLEAVSEAIARLPSKDKDLIGFAFVHMFLLGIQSVAEGFAASKIPVPPESILRFYRGALDAYRESIPPKYRGLF